METAIKNAQGTRSTDRVLEALSTLAAFLDRTINEVKSLDSDFQNRILQAVHDTESSLQAQAAEHLERALADLRRDLQQEFDKKRADAIAEWEAERERLNRELERGTQAAVQWETERARLNSEIERAQKAVTDAAAELEAQKAKAAAAPPAAATISPEAVVKEVERVETLIKQISAIMEDSSTELSTVIRKNVERAELESYLKGIRYAISGGKSK